MVSWPRHRSGQRVAKRGLGGQDGGVMVYRRPGNPRTLAGSPRLASWDRAGHPSQLQLAQFLAEVDTVVSLPTGGGPLALELVVGTPVGTPLDGGGRDLDNYLFPVVQHLGATRFTAVFGRKVRGASTLAVGAAMPVPATTPPQVRVRLTGSYIEPGWKRSLREHLLQAGVAPAAAGPVALDVAIITGVGRNWATCGSR
jgi:hypothetical protein